MKVRDIMVSNINSVSLSTPVIEVAHQMKASGKGVIAVYDGDKFRGLITERDIVVNVVAMAIDPVVHPASSAMNKSQPVISPGDDVMEAVKVMGNSGIRVLPVVESGKLLGVFTLEDLAMAAIVLMKTVQPQASNAAKA